MSISEKSLKWRDMLAEELSFTTVAVAPVRSGAMLDYAHLMTASGVNSGGVNIEIIHRQTMKLPATDDRPNELEWTESGWVVVYTGDDCDTAEKTVYIHPQEDWTDEKILENIVQAFFFVNE